MNYQFILLMKMEHLDSLKRRQMTQQIEVIDALPGSGKTYAMLEYISKRKEYNIDRVYLEDFADGVYQIVIEIKEDK